MGSLLSKRWRATDEKNKETTGRSEADVAENGYTTNVETAADAAAAADDDDGDDDECNSHQLSITSAAMPGTSQCMT